MKAKKKPKSRWVEDSEGWDLPNTYIRIEVDEEGTFCLNVNGEIEPFEDLKDAMAQGEANADEWEQ